MMSSSVNGRGCFRIQNKKLVEMIKGSMMFPSVSSSSAALEILKLEHRLSLLAKRGAHGLQPHLPRRPRSSAEWSEPSWRSTVSEAPPALSPLPCMQLSPDRTDPPTCRCHCPPHFSSHLLEDVADTSVMSAGSLLPTVNLLP